MNLFTRARNTLENIGQAISPRRVNIEEVAKSFTPGLALRGTQAAVPARSNPQPTRNPQLYVGTKNMLNTTSQPTPARTFNPQAARAYSQQRPNQTGVTYHNLDYLASKNVRQAYPAANEPLYAEANMLPDGTIPFHTRPSARRLPPDMVNVAWSDVPVSYEESLQEPAWYSRQVRALQ